MSIIASLTSDRLFQGNMMAKFPKVRSFFRKRILSFGILGSACYVAFALQKYTIIPEFPNLWEIIVTSIGGLFLTGSSYYFSKYRAIGRIDEIIMDRIDHVCNKLSDADDSDKFKAQGDISSPRLLVKQVHQFGLEILEELCRKDVFELVDAGIFCIKDRLLPDHPLAFYPSHLKSNIDPKFLRLLDAYVELYPEEIGIVRTNRNRVITNMVNINDSLLAYKDNQIGQLISEGIAIPYDKAVITPIATNGSAIGYFVLFYHPQPVIPSIINPKEMVENFMFKKIEDWKLDDAVKSVINKERFLLAFYMIKLIDRISNQIIESYIYKREQTKLNTTQIHQSILEILCSVMRAEEGGYIWIERGDVITNYKSSIDALLVRQKFVPYINHLTLASNKKAGKVFTAELSGLPQNLKFDRILFVNVKFDDTPIGQIALFTTRKLDDFDEMVMDMIEDFKLDDLFMLLHYGDQPKSGFDSAHVTLARENSENVVTQVQKMVGK